MTPPQIQDAHVVTAARSTRTVPRKSEGDCIELRNGRILLAYMEFFGDGSDLARTRIVAKESADGGRTWIRHRVVASTPPGEMNIYSPNLQRAQDGRLLLIFMCQHACAEGTTTFHLWSSSDEGNHFAPERTFAERRHFHLCNAVVQRTRQGRLLLPVDDGCSVEQSLRFSARPLPGGSVPPAGDRASAVPRSPSYRSALLFSDDDGLSWRESTGRVVLPMRGAMETHVAETPDGRLVMAMRTQLGSVFLSYSEDGGDSWALPQTTGLRSPEACCALAALPETGNLLLIWNNSPYDPAFASHFGRRSPLSVATSQDAGRTWTEAGDLETDPHRAFSNPGVRFLSNGKVIVNYWTCAYTRNNFMQDIIDLRTAVFSISHPEAERQAG